LNNTEGIRILGTTKVEFRDPMKDVHTAILPIAGCAWVETTEVRALFLLIQ